MHTTMYTNAYIQLCITYTCIHIWVIYQLTYCVPIHTYISFPLLINITN